MKKGITVSTLAVAVTVMLIIATTVSVVGVRSINTANFEDYVSKLRRMSDAVLEYVDTNAAMPTTSEIVAIDDLPEDLIAELANNGDLGSKFYVVDLNLLDVVSNIGDGTTQNENVFIVSEDTNNVYYLKGKKYKGTTYYGLDAINTMNLDKVDATAIKIKGAGAVMLNQSTQLSVDFTPSNTTNRAIKWNSSNGTVAAISSNGKVYGKMEGTVTITATYGDITATHSVTVISPQIGDLVAYTPTADPKGSYDGATYVKDTVTTSATYNTYIESTTTYTPGSMTWVYLGQDEEGNILLTSQETTSFTMAIAGQDGWVTGPARMDTLCNTLYGNSTYGRARNMKVEDVNRTLGYTGGLGAYYNVSGSIITIPTPKTIGALETELGTTLANRITPRLSITKFENYFANFYHYYGTTYKGETTAEYKVIFKKADGTTNHQEFWLSTSGVNARFDENMVTFYVRRVYGGRVLGYSPYSSDENEIRWTCTLRPVIVLGSNIQFGEKNSSGEWTLVVDE